MGQVNNVMLKDCQALVAPACNPSFLGAKRSDGSLFEASPRQIVCENLS
jgi:hypothetical protein